MSRIVLAVSSYLGASLCYQKHLNGVNINTNEDQMMIPKLEQPKQQQKTRSRPLAYKYVPIIKSGLLETETAVQ